MIIFRGQKLSPNTVAREFSKVMRASTLQNPRGGRLAYAFEFVDGKGSEADRSLTWLRGDSSEAILSQLLRRAAGGRLTMGRDI